MYEEGGLSYLIGSLWDVCVHVCVCAHVCVYVCIEGILSVWVASSPLCSEWSALILHFRRTLTA